MLGKLGKVGFKLNHDKCEFLLEKKSSFPVSSIADPSITPGVFNKCVLESVARSERRRAVTAACSIRGARGARAGLIPRMPRSVRVWPAEDDTGGALYLARYTPRKE